MRNQVSNAVERGFVKVPASAEIVQDETALNIKSLMERRLQPLKLPIHLKFILNALTWQVLCNVQTTELSSNAIKNILKFLRCSLCP